MLRAARHDPGEWPLRTTSTSPKAAAETTAAHSALAAREVIVQDSPTWTNVPPWNAWNALVRR